MKRRWLRNLNVLAFVAAASIALGGVSCKAGYCQGYKDACVKDCRKAPVAGKECSDVCDEKLKTNPGYQSCLDK